jgi:hypothetical protein
MNQFEQKPPPPPMPHQIEKKRLSYRPIIITLVCAVLLGGGSCFGWIATLKTLQGKNPGMNGVFAIGFIASVFVFLGACIWLFVALIRRQYK